MRERCRSGVRGVEAPGGRLRRRPWTDRTLPRTRAERARLKAFVSRLSDDALACPVGAHWTVGVGLAHLAFWDRLWLAKFDEWERTGGVVAPQGHTFVN